MTQPTLLWVPLRPVSTHVLTFERRMKRNRMSRSEVHIPSLFLCDTQYLIQARVQARQNVLSRRLTVCSKGWYRSSWGPFEKRARHSPFSKPHEWLLRKASTHFPIRSLVKSGHTQLSLFELADLLAAGPLKREEQPTFLRGVSDRKIPPGQGKHLSEFWRGTDKYQWCASVRRSFK